MGVGRGKRSCVDGAQETGWRCVWGAGVEALWVGRCVGMEGRDGDLILAIKDIFDIFLVFSGGVGL